MMIILHEIYDMGSIWNYYFASLILPYKALDSYLVLAVHTIEKEIRPKKINCLFPLTVRKKIG